MKDYTSLTTEELQLQLTEKSRLLTIIKNFLFATKERELNNQIYRYDEGFMAEIGWAFIQLVRLEDEQEKLTAELNK